MKCSKNPRRPSSAAIDSLSEKPARILIDVRTDMQVHVVEINGHPLSLDDAAKSVCGNPRIDRDSNLLCDVSVKQRIGRTRIDNCFKEIRRLGWSRRRCNPYIEYRNPGMALIRECRMGPLQRPEFVRISHAVNSRNCAASTRRAPSRVLGSTRQLSPHCQPLP